LGGLNVCTRPIAQFQNRRDEILNQPQYSKKSLPAVNASNETDLIAVLKKRIEDLSGSQIARVRKVIKATKNR
jgi:hypothetical protein